MRHDTAMRHLLALYKYRMKPHQSSHVLFKNALGMWQFIDREDTPRSLKLKDGITLFVCFEDISYRLLANLLGMPSENNDRPPMFVIVNVSSCVTMIRCNVPNAYATRFPLAPGCKQ
jgi:hypothetical protein